MIMNERFRAEIIEFIRDLPDSAFAKSYKKRDEILFDEDCIYRLWVNYQKEVEIYECDPERAKKDSVLDVLGIDLDEIPASSWKDILRKDSKVSEINSVEIPAGNIKPGMVLFGNYGHKEIVRDIDLSPSGKCINIRVVDQSNREYTRTLRTWRIVMVKQNSSEDSKGDDIKRIAFEKYRLLWMIRHEHFLPELIGIMDDYWEADPFGEQERPSRYFDHFEQTGFGGERFPAFDEFIDTEYKDVALMKELLSEKQLLEYLKDRSNLL